jgi:hypothetical protein
MPPTTSNSWGKLSSSRSTVGVSTTTKHPSSTNNSKLSPLPHLVQDNVLLGDTVSITGVITRVMSPPSAVVNGNGDSARFDVISASGQCVSFHGPLLTSGFGFGLVVVEVTGVKCKFKTHTLSKMYAVQEIRYLQTAPTSSTLWGYCWKIAQAIGFAANPQRGLASSVTRLSKAEAETLELLHVSDHSAQSDEENETSLLRKQRKAKKKKRHKKQTQPKNKNGKNNTKEGGGLEVLQTHESTAKALYRMFRDILDDFEQSDDFASMHKSSPAHPSDSRQKQQSGSRIFAGDMPSPPTSPFDAMRHIVRKQFDIRSGELFDHPQGVSSRTKLLDLRAVLTRAISMTPRFFHKFPFAREAMEGRGMSSFWVSQMFPLCLRCFPSRVLWRTSIVQLHAIEKFMCTRNSTVPLMLPAGNTVPLQCGRRVSVCSSDEPNVDAKKVETADCVRHPEVCESTKNHKEVLAQDNNSDDVSFLLTPGRPVLSLSHLTSLNFCKDPVPPVSRESNNKSRTHVADQTRQATHSNFFGTSNVSMLDLYRMADSGTLDLAGLFSGSSASLDNDEWHDTGLPIFLLTRISDDIWLAMLFLAIFSFCCQETSSTALVMGRRNPGEDARLSWPDSVACRFDHNSRNNDPKAGRGLYTLVERLQRAHNARCSALGSILSQAERKCVSQLVRGHSTQVDRLCEMNVLFSLECPPSFVGGPPVRYIMRCEDWDDANYVLHTAVPGFIKHATAYSSERTPEEHRSEWMATDYLTEDTWKRGETPSDFHLRQARVRLKNGKLLRTTGKNGLNQVARTRRLQALTPQLRMQPCCPEQVDALRSICDNPITLLTGNPGTGKTSVFAYFDMQPALRRDEAGYPPPEPGENPRVQQANVLGLAPTCLITLLNSSRFGGSWRTSQGMTRFNTLNADLCSQTYAGLRVIVVDEAGMKSVEDMVALLKFAYDQSPVPTSGESDNPSTLDASSSGEDHRMPPTQKKISRTVPDLHNLQRFSYRNQKRKAVESLSSSSEDEESEFARRATQCKPTRTPQWRLKGSLDNNTKSCAPPESSPKNSFDKHMKIKRGYRPKYAVKQKERNGKGSTKEGQGNGGKLNNNQDVPQYAGPTKVLTRLVIVGDRKQLPSVAPGGVIRVLRAVEGVHHVHLEVNHRATELDLVDLTLIFCNESEATHKEQCQELEWVDDTATTPSSDISDSFVGDAERFARHSANLQARNIQLAGSRQIRRLEARSVLVALVQRCYSTPAGGGQLSETNPHPNDVAAGRVDTPASLRFFEMTHANQSQCLSDIVLRLRGPRRHETHLLAYTNRACSAMHLLISQRLGLVPPTAKSMPRDRLVVGQRVQFRAPWPREGSPLFQNQDLVDLTGIEDISGTGVSSVTSQVENTRQPLSVVSAKRVLVFTVVGSGNEPARRVRVPWSADVLECVSAENGFCTTVHTKQGGQCEHIIYIMTGDQNPLMLTAMSRATHRLWVYAAPVLCNSSSAIVSLLSGMTGQKSIVEMLYYGLTRFPRLRQTAFSLAQRYGNRVGENTASQEATEPLETLHSVEEKKEVKNIE